MSSRRNNKAVRVLLVVEDSKADARLLIESLKDCDSVGDINIVGDGEEAMSFLQQQGKYAKAPRPDLVILDLNLPRKDGREVLAEMKVARELKSIPVVILTSSEADEDIDKCYDLGANSYVVKPVDLDEFLDAVRALTTFWLDVARGPERSAQ